MPMFDIPKPLKPRGIRFSLPSGYVLGRVSPGQGDAELIPLAQLSQEQIKSGIVSPGPVAGGGTASGSPVLGIAIPNNSNVLKARYMPLAMVHQDLLMPAATPADIVKCRTAPTVDVVLTIVYDPTTYEDLLAAGYLCTITILAGQTTGTVVWAVAPTLLVAGTMLYLYTALYASTDAPPVVDTTFIGIEILLSADAA